MSKRIQTHPATTKKSIFHQGLIKTLVIYALSEVQRSWDWLIQSLKPKQQEPKSKTAREKKPGKGKKASQTTDAFVKESSPAARVTHSSKRKLQTQHGIEYFPRGEPNEKITKGRRKKLKLGKELDVQTDPDIKNEPDELDEPEDHTTNPVKRPTKQKKQSTGKKVAEGKKMSKKKELVSNYPKRATTRAANKLRLNSKALFHPSIKKENLIIIEDNSEDTMEEVERQTLASSSHRLKEESEEQRKKHEKGKQIAQYSRRPVTRETKRSGSVPETTLKGTYVINDDVKLENDSFPEINQLQDVPETRKSKSTEEEDLSTGFSSKYEIKLRKPRTSIDLNLPAPVEEHPEFRMETRKEKDRVKELQGIIMKLRQEKSLVEKWNAKQQEKIQELKKKRKDQQALLKEVRESNIKLYWHNVVLKTKLKQRDTRASAIIIQ
jgi:hypothetical protein